PGGAPRGCPSAVERGAGAAGPGGRNSAAGRERDTGHPSEDSWSPPAGRGGVALRNRGAARHGRWAWPASLVRVVAARAFAVQPAFRLLRAHTKRPPAMIAPARA